MEDELRERAARYEAALRQIAAYGDPYEIAEEPDEFGGTDDGLETVCMAYENMQSVARRALEEPAQ